MGLLAASVLCWSDVVCVFDGDAYLDKWAGSAGDIIYISLPITPHDESRL